MSSGTEDSTSGSEIPSIRDGKDTSPSLDIRIWFDFVRQYYDSPAHMQATTVAGLHWYKYAGGVEHEYVLATVLRQDQKIYLRLERRASDEAFVDEKTVVKEETLRSLTPENRAQVARDVSMEKNAIRKRKMWASSRRSSNRISLKDDPPKADDTVSQVSSSNGVTEDDGGDVHLLASYDFSLNTIRPFYLRDLVFILQHIHKSSGSYTLLTEQCYWFSRTCIGVAQRRCRGKETRTAYYNTAGTYRLAKLDTPKLKSTLTLQINKDQSPQVEEFAKDVDADIQRHNDDLYIKYMNGEGGRIQAEEEREEERRQKERAQEEAHRERQQRERVEQQLKELEERLAHQQFAPAQAKTQQ